MKTKHYVWSNPGYAAWAREQMNRVFLRWGGKPRWRRTVSGTSKGGEGY